MDRINPGLHIAVQLARCEKDPSAPQGKRRTHIGTVYFPEGTSANEVCLMISRRQATDSGIWLLQTRSIDTELAQCVDKNGVDAEYSTVKDSKHVLTDGNAYLALYYNGPDIFLMMP